MNIIVHLIWTVLPSVAMHLDKRDFILALVFGVLIDLDHIIPLIPYAIKNKKIFYSGIYIKTPVQEAIFAPVIALISLYFRTWVPIIFFSIHIVLDYLFASVNRPFSPFSKFELRAPFNPKTKVYWIFSLASVIIFLIFMLQEGNYEYLLKLIS